MLLNPWGSVRPAVQTPHLLLKFLRAVSLLCSSRTMLVEQIGEEVFLLIRQAIKESKEVRLVSQHDLRGYDACCSRFAYH